MSNSANFVQDDGGPETDGSHEISPIGQSGARISSLDFIRGIAVMGILAANIIVFGQPWNAYTYPAAFLSEHGPVSDWLLVVQFVLIDGKMRGLFTLLFGAGVYLFMEKAWAKGRGRKLQALRLFWLLIFGLIHYFLIWPGDILTYYALAGFLLLFCLDWEPSTQLKIGLLGYLVGAAMMALFMTIPWAVAETNMGEGEELAQMQIDLDLGITEAMADDKIEAELISAGDYAGLVAHRVEVHWYEPMANFLFFAFETVPLMLIGMALYRFGFFSGAFDRRKMRFWGWAGISAGAAATLAAGLWMKAGGFTYYSTLAAFMGWSVLPRLAMTLGFATLLVLYAPSATGWLGQRVSAAGRAAFTNYLGTSALMIILFHGWGFGLFGQLERPALYAVMAAAWIIMLAWSKPWLERFRYGPLEWLWRCLTYRKMFALRR